MTKQYKHPDYSKPNLIYVFESDPILINRRVSEKIYSVRGERVMLDSDIAALYGIETKQLKRQVRRNISRFPADFMIELSPAEAKELRSHFGTSKKGGNRYKVMAFTSKGVSMLSSVISTEEAIQMNIAIMRVFADLAERIEVGSILLDKIKEVEALALNNQGELTKLGEWITLNLVVPPHERRKIGFQEKDDEDAKFERQEVDLQEDDK